MDQQSKSKDTVPMGVAVAVIVVLVVLLAGAGVFVFMMIGQSQNTTIVATVDTQSSVLDNSGANDLAVSEDADIGGTEIVPENPLFQPLVGAWYREMDSRYEYYIFHADGSIFGIVTTLNNGLTSYRFGHFLVNQDLADNSLTINFDEIFDESANDTVWRHLSSPHRNHFAFSRDSNVLQLILAVPMASGEMRMQNQEFIKVEQFPEIPTGHDIGPPITPDDEVHRHAMQMVDISIEVLRNHVNWPETLQIHGIRYMPDAIFANQLHQIFIDFTASNAFGVPARQIMAITQLGDTADVSFSSDISSIRDLWDLAGQLGYVLEF